MKVYGAIMGLLIGALGLCLLVACNGRTTAMSANDMPQVNGQALPLGSDNIPRITVAQAKQAMENGEAFFIDTRGADAYQREHIRGAINMPMSEAADRAKELPKNKLLIAYCD
jgi:3-mercaptopyruvate sulfurtransferase SseA